MTLTNRLESTSAFTHLHTKSPKPTIVTVMFIVGPQSEWWAWLFLMGEWNDGHYHCDGCYRCDRWTLVTVMTIVMDGCSWMVFTVTVIKNTSVAMEWTPNPTPSWCLMMYEWPFQHTDDIIHTWSDFLKHFQRTHEFWNSYETNDKWKSPEQKCKTNSMMCVVNMNTNEASNTTDDMTGIKPFTTLNHSSFHIHILDT